MTTLQEFYQLLKSHFIFYELENEQKELNITLSFQQVKELKCALDYLED